MASDVGSQYWKHLRFNIGGELINTRTPLILTALLGSTQWSSFLGILILKFGLIRRCSTIVCQQLSPKTLVGIPYS